MAPPGQQVGGNAVLLGSLGNACHVFMQDAMLSARGGGICHRGLDFAGGVPLGGCKVGVAVECGCGSCGVTLRALLVVLEVARALLDWCHTWQGKVSGIKPYPRWLQGHVSM